MSPKLIFLTEQYIINNPEGQHVQKSLSWSNNLPFSSCWEFLLLTSPTCNPPGHLPWQQRTVSTQVMPPPSDWCENTKARLLISAEENSTGLSQLQRTLIGLAEASGGTDCESIYLSAQSCLPPPPNLGIS